MKINIGITGYNGFVGRHLFQSLINNNKIKNITLIGRTPPAQMLDRIKWVKFDLIDPYQGDQIQLDTLLHLGGAIKKGAKDNKSKEYFGTNVFGTYNLLKNFQVTHLIYTSTVDVYSKTLGNITEKSAIKPPDEYSFSKFLGESVCKNILPPGKVTILRIGNIYGSSDDSSKLIPSAFRNLSKGLNVPIYNGGQYTRDYIYISDLINILNVFIEKKKAGIFNVVSGNSTPIINVVKKIQKLLGVDKNLIEFRSLPISQFSTEFNNSKLLSIIGDYHFKDLEVGLKEMYETSKNFL